ncbi:hypothetical protein [uncultured Roseobacter sp.]|uniref:hypothetical protein n=1 Tax=uncultured Roseobacter sp. TaxID=114847 RepID=UPI00261B7A8C|nr:hypothetical protein [uncultured Roseobacter sp.]
MFIGVSVGIDATGGIAIGEAVFATIEGLTNNPTHGPTPQIETVLTGVLNGLQGGEVVVHRWRVNGVLIGGANAVTYTPIAGQNLQSLRYAPTVDGVEVLSAPYTVRYPPPVYSSQPFADHIDPFVGTPVNITPGSSITPGAVPSIVYVRRNGVDDSEHLTGTEYNAEANTGEVTYREALTSSGGTTYSDVVTFTLHGGTFDQADNTITLTTNATSGIWPITASGAYTGTANLDLEDLQTGPVALFDTLLSHDGSPDVGDNLPITPALWAITGAGNLVYSTNGTNPVDASDPSAPTLLADAADAGASLTVTETMTDQNGSQQVSSNEVLIVAGSSISLPASPISAGGGNTLSYTFPSVALGATDANRHLLVFVAGFKAANSNALSLTVGGQTCTKVSELFDPGNIGTLALFQADADPAGTTGDIVATLTGGVGWSQSRVGIHVVRVVKSGPLTLEDLAFASTAVQDHTLAVDVTAGGILLAGAFKSGDTVQPGFTGVTTRGSPYGDIDTGEILSLGFDSVVTTEIGRQVVANSNQASPGRHLAIAASFLP